MEKKEKKEVVQVWCNLQVGKYTKCLRETLKQESNSLQVGESFELLWKRFINF